MVIAFFSVVHVFVLLLDIYKRCQIYKRLKHHVTTNQQQVITEMSNNIERTAVGMSMEKKKIIRTQLLNEFVDQETNMNSCFNSCFRCVRRMPPYTFFSLNRLCGLFSTVLIIGSCLYSYSQNITHTTMTNSMSSTILAISHFGLWVSLTENFLFVTEIRVLLKVVVKSVQTGFIFFGGLLPIIMAYIVSGQVLFAEQSRKFDSFSSTLQTVFTLWNGDSMGDVINDCIAQHFFMGYIYCYTFVMLWVFVLLNVFLAVVGDLYNDLHDQFEQDLDVMLAVPANVQEENGDDEEKKIRTKDYLTRSRDCHFLRTLAIIALMKY